MQLADSIHMFSYNLKAFLMGQSSGGGVAGAFGAIIVFIVGEEN